MERVVDAVPPSRPAVTSSIWAAVSVIGLSATFWSSAALATPAKLTSATLAARLSNFCIVDILPSWADVTPQGLLNERRDNPCVIFEVLLRLWGESLSTR